MTTAITNNEMTNITYRRSRLATKLAFLKNGSCSKTLMTVLNEAYGQPMPVEELATHPFAGGLMKGYQCGMLWGASLAAGGAAYRRFGDTSRGIAAAVAASSRLVPAFASQNVHINCLEITETDPRDKRQVFMNFFVKGGTFVCMRRAADFAPVAADRINAALNDSRDIPHCQSASCAHRLAKKMGASDQHAVMAAGLAGGIGLAGGACGALGAAIWLTGIEGQRLNEKNRITNERIDALVEAFLKVTDYEFECADITQKRFTTVEDHVAYLQSGGCSKIIDALSNIARQLNRSHQIRRSA